MTMPKSFQDELRNLDELWLSRQAENQSPEELAVEVIGYILAREQLRHCVTPDTPASAAIDQRTLATLEEPDMLDPAHSVFEVFIYRLSRDPAGAVQYLTKRVEDRSAAQSERAKKDRLNRRDGITHAILECLEDNPSLSAKAVGAYLRDNPAIDLIAGEYRHKHDASTMDENLLDSRVSYYRGKLRKNSGQLG
jgi:hypothetical protein